MSRLLPGQQATFEANYARLERDLLALDQRLEDAQLPCFRLRIKPAIMVDIVPATPYPFPRLALSIHPGELLIIELEDGFCGQAGEVNPVGDASR